MQDPLQSAIMNLGVGVFLVLFLVSYVSHLTRVVIPGLQKTNRDDLREARQEFLQAIRACQENYLQSIMHEKVHCQDLFRNLAEKVGQIESVVKAHLRPTSLETEVKAKPDHWSKGDPA